MFHDDCQAIGLPVPSLSDIETKLEAEWHALIRTGEGLPERVQEIANTLDKAMPDTFEWHDFASLSGDADIVLKGSGSREIAV